MSTVETERPPPRAQSGRASYRTLSVLATTTLVVAILYYAKPVLMPFALAVLLSFLLSPIVDALCHVGVKRSISVVLVVLLMFSISGMVVWGVARQINTLANELPAYKGNIRQKLVDLRSAGKGSPLEKIRQTIRELRGELKRHDKREQQLTNTPPQIGEPAPVPSEEKPVPVVVQGEKQGTWSWPSAVGPIFESLAKAFLVVVLVVFMLLRRRELRNRIIALFGYPHMPTTTRAVDEASGRISRYLLMQTIINSTFGLCVGLGLSFIGVPYALLWGFLAGLLRFIPYVGPWLGTSMPLLLSLAVFPGWLQPLLVICLFVVLELTINMAMEPLLYGHSAGVSEVALLLSVAFWTWIWGPVGLALATPLTVCVVVLGKYVPELGFIQLLMGDQPAIETHLLLYQRMLAGDQAEALEIVRDYARSHKLSEVYDDLLIPVLLSAKRDQPSGGSEEESAFVTATVRLLTEKAAGWVKRGATPKNENRQCLIAAPADGILDKLALEMLAKLVAPRIDIEVLSPEILSAEMIDQVEKGHPAVLVVGSLRPGSAAEARYLCKRFRARFGPSLKVVLARFGSYTEPQQAQQFLSASGADTLASTLSETRNQIFQLAQLENDESQPPTHKEPKSAFPVGVEQPARHLY